MYHREWYISELEFSLEILSPNGIYSMLLIIMAKFPDFIRDKANTECHLLSGGAENLSKDSNFQ